MTTAHPPGPENGDETGATGAPVDADHGHEPVDRVGTLRGAGVGGVDTRRLGRILIGLIMATLAVLVVVFTVVGVHHNQQDDRLHHDGLPVTFSVSGCLGLLGGSGSNAAGYSCRGSYTLDGQTYRVRLPGNDFHRPGAQVPALAVPGDPTLVSPVSLARTERSSAGVFLVPVILFVILVLLVTLLLFDRQRHRKRGEEITSPPAAST
jgi:uncharacterized membrane protein